MFKRFKKYIDDRRGSGTMKNLIGVMDNEVIITQVFIRGGTTITPTTEWPDKISLSHETAREMAEIILKHLPQPAEATR